MSIQTTEHDVVVLGAGFGVRCMGAQLKQTGIENFAIFDKCPGLGGVWRDKSYPSAACDTEAHLYRYSFFPHLRVCRVYADRNEQPRPVTLFILQSDSGHRYRQPFLCSPSSSRQA